MYQSQCVAELDEYLVPRNSTALKRRVEGGLFCNVRKLVTKNTNQCSCSDMNGPIGI